MRLSLCLTAGLAGLVGMAAALAAPAQPLVAPAPAASVPKADESLKRTVIEDDGARIEETRLRGAAQRITVQSKIGGVAAYEIIVAPAGRDAAQQRGAAGQRAWSIFSF